MKPKGGFGGHEAATLRVLYIAYWGALEPLGRSLVIPAVCELACRGVRLTLLTFDKPADLADREAVVATEALLQARGIRWIRLRYHKRPRIPATAFDILHGWCRGVTEAVGDRPHIVHARTFIGGLLGLLLAPVIRARLIYHNEGFYPDEQVDGGFWKAGSVLHRVTKALEATLYARADGLIVLSRRAKVVVEARPVVARRQTPIVVVPSCVDLALFVWNPPQRSPKRNGLRLVYTGAVGGRYTLDRMGRFVAIARRRADQVCLRVLTPAEPEQVATILRDSGMPSGSWTVTFLPHSAIPGELSRHDAGLYFAVEGLSEHGGSPTKIGEYWASGLPVVTTPNVSDTDDIIRRERVGVIVKEHSEQAYAAAADELLSLLEDPGLPARCRRAAEAHYGLDAAVERQMLLYRELLGLAGGRKDTPARETSI